MNSANIRYILYERSGFLTTKTKKIVFSALMASLVCVATMIVRIPTPMQGYIHLGDAVVLLCGWTLGPLCGFCSAAIGSALADMLSGYMIYAPATFFIKGLSALVGWVLYIHIFKKKKTVWGLVISAIAAELLMVGLYYIFEGFMYGFAASLVNIPANLIQAAGGIVFGTVLMKALWEKLFEIND